GWKRLQALRPQPVDHQEEGKPEVELRKQSRLRLSGYRFLAEINPVFKPIVFRPPKKRACSIFMQRSITTSRPAARARSAAGSWITPSCIHTTRAPLAIASSTMDGTAAGSRKISTTSIELGMARGIALSYGY